MDGRESFSVNIKLFTIIGLWLSQENAQQKEIYFWYSVVIALYNTTFLISQIIYLFTVMGDYEEMVGALFLMATISAGYIKMYYLLFDPQRVNNLLNGIQLPSFQPKKIAHEVIIRSGNKLARFNSIFFVTICVCAATLLGINPILDGSYKKLNLPVGIWTPFDLRINNYIYVYAYLLSEMNLNALINSVYDTFFTAFMIHVGVQLDILAESLANIKMDNTRNAHIEDGFVEKLIDCIEHYMDILRFTKEMENIFSSGVMAEFCAAGFVFAVTLCHMTMTPPMSFQFVALASYLSCIMYQLFVYCWFANEITLKSLNVLKAAYKGDWHVCGHKKYRRILLLLMVRLERPIIIEAGHFIPLSIETFMTIVKSSWSYFNLLRQVNVDEITE